MFHHTCFTTITTQQHLFLQQRPSLSTSSLKLSSQQRCANYNSHIEDEFENDESANQQETEESNFLVKSQNILNSLREQQQQPKKKQCN